jgi:uncharacterized membrane protein YhaH (DUF805 family)
MDKPASYWMVQPLRNYAKFSGRARRAEFWWYILFIFSLLIAANIFDVFIGLPIFSIIIYLGIIIPSLAVQVRRLHDTNRSGWWLLAPFLISIPVYAVAIAIGLTGALGGLAGSGGAAAAGIGGAIIVLAIGGLAIFIVNVLLLVWFCSRGTDGSNRYGPDPLGAGDGDLAKDFA